MLLSSSLPFFPLSSSLADSSHYILTTILSPPPMQPLKVYTRRTRTSHLIAHYVSYDHLSSSLCAFATSVSSVFVPNTFQEALSISKWQTAMEDERSAPSS